MFDLETMLRDHLTHNFYPPIDARFAHDAESAIDLMLADEPYELITMVNGVTLMAATIVTQLHLEQLVAHYQAAPVH